MPKVVDRNRYRKELLDGCLKLFSERGYGSVTMRQIAQSLGVSTGTLYHYFPSKESIFIQLVQELCERDVSSFFAQAPPEGTLQERLEVVMNFVLQNLQHYHQQLLLWVDFFQHTRSGKEPEIDFLRQIWDGFRDDLVQYLETSDLALVDHLMIFIDGLVIQFIYNRGIHDLDWYRQQTQFTIQIFLLHHAQTTSSTPT